MNFTSVYNPITRIYEEQAIFPCDNLYAGLTIEGLPNTIFTSLSVGIEYQYIDNEQYDYPYYYATIDFGCFDFETIQNLSSLGDCEEKEDGTSIQYLPISLNLYCKTLSGYEPVDFCDDYDEYSDILYGSGDITDCDPTFETGFSICCPQPENLIDELVQVRTSDVGILIEGTPEEDLTYIIFNINGVKQISGILKSNYNKSNYIYPNRDLENGIYILVITGKEYYSSHKFISFR